MVIMLNTATINVIDVLIFDLHLTKQSERKELNSGPLF